MIYGYARVSTTGQARDGNSLEGQKELLIKFGVEKIFFDSYTGTKIERPQLKLLLDSLKSGDMLVVTKLDRIARSIRQGSELIESLINKGIVVNILNLGIMDDTPASKLVRNIFLSFAEFERDMIIERTQEGKMIARQKNGFHEGRPKKYKEIQVRHALDLLENNSYKDVSEITGISISTLTRAKRQQTNGI